MAPLIDLFLISNRGVFPAACPKVPDVVLSVAAVPQSQSSSLVATDAVVKDADCSQLVLYLFLPIPATHIPFTTARRHRHGGRSFSTPSGISWECSSVHQHPALPLCPFSKRGLVGVYGRSGEGTDFHRPRPFCVQSRNTQALGRRRSNQLGFVYLEGSHEHFVLSFLHGLL